MSRPRLVTDDQILTAMRRGVLARGARVPLEAVADELSVSVPALLKRFGTRRALMIAALKPPARPDWLEAIRRGPDARALETQLHEMFTRILNYLGEVVPCVAALRESGVPPERIFAKRSGPERAHEALRRWLELARERGLISATELDVVVHAMLGAVHGRAFFAHIRNQQPTARVQRDFVTELARFFTRALTSKPQP
jgi:AcrR family transcriptional regulator